MAAARAFPRRCTYFLQSRPTSSILLPSRVAIPQRQFTSGIRFLQDSTQVPATESEEDARTIALLKLPKRAVKSEIEAFVKQAGVDIKRIKLLLDRFTFHNRTMCFVELADEHQAQKALKLLDEKTLMDSTIYVRTPVEKGTTWTRNEEPDAGTSKSRYFYHDDEGPYTAIKPLLEGRRMMLSVMTPGWGEGGLGTRRKVSLEIIHKYLGQYGIEALGSFSAFYGDLKPTPRLLCFLDFETKEGAMSAVEAVHDKEIEGRKVHLQPSQLSPWRFHHIGKVDKSVLTLLQEKGIAPLELSEDVFVEKKKTRRANKKQEEKPETTQAYTQGLK